MPLFEYRCDECQTRFDVLHKGAENPDMIECPSCSSRAATKQFSSFSASTSGAASSGSGCSDCSCATPSPYSGCAGGMCGLQ